MNQLPFGEPSDPQHPLAGWQLSGGVLFRRGQEVLRLEDVTVLRFQVGGSDGWCHLETRRGQTVHLATHLTGGVPRSEAQLLVARFNTLAGQLYEQLAGRADVKVVTGSAGMAALQLFGALLLLGFGLTRGASVGFVVFAIAALVLFLYAFKSRPRRFRGESFPQLVLK